MSDAATVIDRWLVGLPPEATFERVRAGFWYVRIPGAARQWIPFEIDAGERSVKLTSHVIIEPDEAHTEVYAFLLRHNHAASGIAFSIDGKEGVICLVARIPLGQLTEQRLDELIGQIVQQTEQTFRTILSIGFASRFKKS